MPREAVVLAAALVIIAIIFLSPAYIRPDSVGVYSYLRSAVFDRDLLFFDEWNAFGLIRDAAIRRFWLDDLLESIYRRIILGFSWIIGWIDRYLVDGTVNLLSAWTLGFGDRLRGIQSGVPQDYVYAVALGVLLLFVWSQF